MRKQQVAKGQSVRWKQELKHLAAKEISTALQEQRRLYQAKSQAHKIGSLLESFLFWLSFIFFQVIQIILAAALEVFYKETKSTASQSGQTHQDSVAVNHEDSMLSQTPLPQAAI